MAENKQLPGKFVWFEHVSKDAKKAQAFYGEVIGWKTHSMPMGSYSYDMVLAGDTPDSMIGGYATPKREGQGAHWISYASVENVDAALKAASANGGKVLEPAHDTPGVGRMARIADPQGAICVFKAAEGDSPDAEATAGQFFWNELHTTEPEKALAFYAKVLGYEHRSMDMGPGGTYHILSKGGVDRGGVTSHLPPGVGPHWLPYVRVEDTDATISRARNNGAVIRCRRRTSRASGGSASSRIRWARCSRS